MRKDDILLNEYRELSILRERSIKSIASSANAYYIILTIVIAAIGLFIKDIEIPNSQISILHVEIVILCIGIALYRFGWFIYHLLISSHINLTSYTRKLNLTRGYLVAGKDLNHKILLPTDDESEYGITGPFREENINKKGVVGVVKIINSIIIGLTFLFLAFFFSRFSNTEIDQCCFHSISILSGLLSGGVSLIIHNEHFNNMIKKAEKKWECDIKHKDKFV